MDESLNLISLKRDIAINKKRNTFIVLGCGLGLGLLHGGIKYEPNYNNTGFSYICSFIILFASSEFEFLVYPLLGTSYQHRFGDSRNLRIFANSSNGQINNYTGDLFVQNDSSSTNEKIY